MRTFLVILTGVLILGVFYVGALLDFRSDCVSAEEGIKAQFDQNKNSYDNMWKEFRELAQVPAMRARDVQRVYTAAIQGRYGENGSQAVFQAIQEANPGLSSDLYLPVSHAIEEGRQRFAADQTALIDRKREYQTLLRSNKAAFVNPLLGFPTIRLNDYRIITSGATDTAFSTGQADEIQLSN
jgi:hypothetical protein